MMTKIVNKGVKKPVLRWVSHLIVKQIVQSNDVRKRDTSHPNMIYWTLDLIDLWSTSPTVLIGHMFNADKIMDGIMIRAVPGILQGFQSKVVGAAILHHDQ